MVQRWQAESGHGHPYGVQPWGNFYLQQQPEIRTSGLGLLSPLPDDLMLSLLYLMPAADLVRLGLASKALYCFAHTTDLWKALTVEELGGDFQWCGSWRETYLCHKVPGYKPGSHKPILVEGFYSDFLHQPWFCATVKIRPEWLEVDNIDRRSALSAAEFKEQYESQSRPVILTDAISDWPALEKWDRNYLAAALAGRPVGSPLCGMSWTSCSCWTCTYYIGGYSSSHALGEAVAISRGIVKVAVAVPRLHSTKKGGMKLARC
eukprot:GHRR01025909.1.p1 GENE.GHRR01025909.1~~GHRR01025909.1.p1  ORF type:complete len:263 (+),score=55.50 GHRR01025909.1:176-964(+)